MYNVIIDNGKQHWESFTANGWFDLLDKVNKHRWYGREHYQGIIIDGKDTDVATLLATLAILL